MTARYIVSLVLTAILFGGVQVVAQESDDDCKNQLFLSSVTKGRLSDDDRDTVKEYLKEHRSDFRAAPVELVTVFDATRLWTDDMSRHAQPVPKSLAKEIAKPVDGTAWFIFNRSFVVVESATRRVIDRIRVK